MSDQSQEPFDAVGDEHIEARIVAWVLGETSAFEAAELERLCEERPELRVFRRRIQALHGLVCEAAASEADRSWKLPPGKRQALDAILGPQPNAAIAAEKIIRYSGRRALWAIAACVALTVYVIQMVNPFWETPDQVLSSHSQTDYEPTNVNQLNRLEIAIRDQEDMVEERRKVLGTIVRNKGIIYKGQDSFYGRNGVDEDQAARAAQPPLTGETKKDTTPEDAIKRGLDSQDYADAKSDYENDVDLLQRMKLKKVELAVAEGTIDGNLAYSDKLDQSPSPAAAPPPAAETATAYPVESRALTDRRMDMKQSAAQGQLTRNRELQPRINPAGTASRPELPEASPAQAMDGGSGLGWASKNGLSAPAAGPSDLAMGAATRWLKSADEAISRNNIDAIPNNPDDESRFGEREVAATKRQETGGKMEDVRGRDSSASMPTLSAKDQPSQSSAFYDRFSSSNELEPPAQSSAGVPSLANAETKPPALADEHNQNVDKVRRGLYTAEGNFNLGNYDEAKKTYEDVLKTDPYNAAARRGIERVATAKSDYYRAAYDHTRAELLSQVDSEWELAVPEKSEVAADSFAEPAMRAAPQFKIKEKTEPETIASEDPYSTFSLNVSDASFQLAKAALDKGEQPAANDINTEQFYNAVDYGDPAPGADQPVAATVEQSAHPVVPGRNLVRIALRTASAGRSAAQALRLTLLVDQSGSMVREDRRAAMDQALTQLGGLLTENDQVTIVGFSRTPHLLAESLSGAQGKKLSDIINQAASEGGTNLEEAMKLGARLAERHQLAGAQNRIVLFTDGAANLGNADPDKLEEQVKAMRQKGIAFDIAGIGTDGLNDRLLAQLARHGNGRYYVVAAEKNDSLARQLAGAFRPAAENVKVQVIFNPQRVGNYKLIGFENDRLKTEDFRNDTVDAAELAADEAGVALYQIQPLPDGSGEIGEVSVRFRDVASGEMVERSWTIPYEEAASAFDRATPSMQLAGLAMMAGEKLRGGAPGAAIDFKQFSNSIAEVRGFYKHSPRVGEMLRVIDQVGVGN